MQDCLDHLGGRGRGERPSWSSCPSCLAPLAPFAPLGDQDCKIGQIVSLSNCLHVNPASFFNLDANVCDQNPENNGRPRGGRIQLGLGVQE